MLQLTIEKQEPWEFLVNKHQPKWVCTLETCELYYFVQIKIHVKLFYFPVRRSLLCLSIINIILQYSKITFSIIIFSRLVWILAIFVFSIPRIITLCSWCMASGWWWFVSKAAAAIISARSSNRWRSLSFSVSVFTPFRRLWSNSGSSQ